jgi:predicted phosphoribosyltransferase
METTRFRDRTEAGRVLAERLREYADGDDVVVLALPRGGVPVAHEVAKALHAPLSVFVARKLGVPGYPELAMGAIASGGSVVLDEGLVGRLGVSRQQLQQVVIDEAGEVARREELYRGGRELPDLEGKTVILVDDGLATGATMRAAVLALRQLNPAKIVVAVPVAAEETCRQFEDVADHVVCAVTPRPFYAVGQWYEDFDQTTDEDVRDLLAQSRDGS